MNNPIKAAPILIIVAIIAAFIVIGKLFVVGFDNIFPGVILSYITLYVLWILATVLCILILFQYFYRPLRTIPVWRIIMWAGIICIVVLGVFQPTYNPYPYYHPYGWKIELIIDGLADTTIPLLIRIGITTAIVAITFLPSVKLKGRQRIIMAVGTLAAFMLSLFNFADGNPICLFHPDYEFGSITVFLIGLTSVVTAALMISLYDRNKQTI